MAIGRYVEERVFGADALSAMSKAFEAAIWTLEIGRDEMKREAVARLAQSDGSLDVTTLHRRAVAEFGSPTVTVLINNRGHGSASAPGEPH